MKIHLIAAVAAAALAATAPGASAADSAPPSVAFTTPSGAVIVGVLGGVRGTARDDTGVAGVRVTYCGNGTIYAGGGWACGGLAAVIESHDATLSCASSGRTCTWVADVPLQPDNYLVFARATDVAGRSASAGDPILVTVV